MRLRAPVADDAPAVLAVLLARDIADLGVPDYALDDLLDEWRGSDIALAADAQVVEVGGRIVAYGVVRRPGTSAEAKICNVGICIPDLFRLGSVVA